MDTGIHPGLSMDQYLRAPAVSASTLKRLIDQCPYAAWYESHLNPKAPSDESSAVQNAGTIAHAMLLEGTTANVEVIDPNHYPTRSSGNIPDGWTNKEIKAARDHAIACGKIPVFPSTMREINGMVNAALAFIESLRNTEPAIWQVFQPNCGDSELTLVWEEDGIKYRARPDRWSRDRVVMADYKTGGTTAEPATWARRQMISMGYHLKAAHYIRAAKVLASTNTSYVWLVQEQEAPYLCSLITVNPHGWQTLERRMARARAEWAACVKANSFPAYPNRVCHAELMPWELDRLGDPVEGHGIAYDVAKAGWQEAKESAQKLGFDREHEPLFD